MSEQITIEELEKASHNVQRLSEFIGERREWILASDAGEAATSFANAARSLATIISDLTRTYNRARQSQITSEILEVISGAEALK